MKNRSASVTNKVLYLNRKKNNTKKCNKPVKWETEAPGSITCQGMQIITI